MGSMMQMGDASGLVERLQSAKTSIEEVTTIFKNPVRALGCRIPWICVAVEVFLCSPAMAVLGGDDVCLCLHCRVPVSLRD
jgi:hypothetical protein